MLFCGKRVLLATFALLALPSIILDALVDASQHNIGPESVAGLVLNPHQRHRGILNRWGSSINVEILCYGNMPVDQLSSETQFSDQANELFYRDCIVARARNHNERMAPHSADCPLDSYPDALGNICYLRERSRFVGIFSSSISGMVKASRDLRDSIVQQLKDGMDEDASHRFADALGWYLSWNEHHVQVNNGRLRINSFGYLMKKDFSLDVVDGLATIDDETDKIRAHRAQMYTFLNKFFSEYRFQGEDPHQKIQATVAELPRLPSVRRMTRPSLLGEGAPAA
ncbi:hypothetical protein BDF22DRAFT_743622 [Syncephalis plumigaleata]|nr:hypothetical protein BDF22DRAFT_743622 [Syncephalis plumigaleata]